MMCPRACGQTGDIGTVTSMGEDIPATDLSSKQRPENESIARRYRKVGWKIACPAKVFELSRTSCAFALALPLLAFLRCFGPFLERQCAEIFESASLCARVCFAERVRCGGGTAGHAPNCSRANHPPGRNMTRIPAGFPCGVFTISSVSARPR